MTACLQQEQAGQRCRQQGAVGSTGATHSSLRLFGRAPDHVQGLSDRLKAGHAHDSWFSHAKQHCSADAPYRSLVA